MNKPLPLMAAAGGLLSLAISHAAHSASGLISPEWPTQACAALSQTPELTDKLASSGRVSNDKGGGYKIL